MAFLYISPDEFRQHLLTQYGAGASSDTFRSPDTFEPTPAGTELSNWLTETGELPEMKAITRWVGGSDEIAIMGFGHDYDLLRPSLSPDLRESLDVFYAPIRTATWRPESVQSEHFDGGILKALGVMFEFPPKRCWELREIGYYAPFVAHFAQAFKNPSPEFSARSAELVEDRDFRNLLGRYDAFSQVLRAAYHLGSRSRTGKHLLISYYW